MSNSEDFQDTGMTSVFYQGVDYEQERIIKLLEDECDDGWPTGVKHLETTLSHLIALIKGEK